MSSIQNNLPKAYVFWIASLMFGLPLLSSFYMVSYVANSGIRILLPYVLLSIIIGLIILVWRRPKKTAVALQEEPRESAQKDMSFRLGYSALIFASFAVVFYWLLRYYVDSSFPSPNSEFAGAMGLLYLITISLAAVFAVPFLLMLVFPALRHSLSTRKNLSRIAIAIGASYFVIYMLLMNQIVITGFTTPPSNFVPSPTGSYPFAFIFTSGPSPNSALESAFYVPQVTVQLSPYVNMLLMPFELVLAVTLSSLVASSIVITYSLIKRSSRHSCLTGATISGLGGFFGFTATCPMCLAPTLVSVFLGGVSATVPSFYSHLSGVVIPPLISVAALLAGIIFLNSQSNKSQTSSLLNRLSIN